VRRRAVLPILVLLAALAGCGGGGAGNGKLTVSAAASLKKALPQYQPSARYSFAGSDVLAAQIKAGARPDVYAAANTRFPQQLFAAGLVEKPVVFAGNRLVIAVPASSDIASTDDLARSGVKLAIGSESVPVGEYTRKVLGGLDPATRKSILANVRSSEPDVKGVIGKLTQGAVDAGFVYVTDVEATDGKLKAIELPADLQPSVAYGVAIVKGGKNPEAARRFVDGLVNGDGARILQAAGFEKPA
jgi:molybdate transport system substrate-binding protein